MSGLPGDRGDLQLTRAAPAIMLQLQAPVGGVQEGPGPAFIRRYNILCAVEGRPIRPMCEYI